MRSIVLIGFVALFRVCGRSTQTAGAGIPGEHGGAVAVSAGLTTEVAQTAIAKVMPGRVQRYEVPGLRALKYVVWDALPGGVYSTLHAGLHWQKAAIWVLLDLEID